MSQIANITTANTFAEWLVATQSLIALINLISDGGTTANANVLVSRTNSTLTLQANNGSNVTNQLVIPLNGNAPYLGTNANNIIWTKFNDGAGSGLDADLLGGNTTASYLTLIASANANAQVAFTLAQSTNTSLNTLTANVAVVNANLAALSAYSNANFLLSTNTSANPSFGGNNFHHLVGANVVGLVPLANSANLVIDSVTNGTMYIIWGFANTGNNILKTSTNLTWNPSTGAFSAPNFYGTFNGPVLGAVNGVVGGVTPNTGSFTSISVTSTSQVNNLNANTVQGGTWAVPLALGSVTANNVDATRLREKANDYGVLANTATVTLELDKYNHFVFTANATTSAIHTIAVSGTPASGLSQSFYLEIKNGQRSADGKIIWPAAFKWVGGSGNRPLDTALAASGTNIFTAVTRDGGTRFEIQHIGVAG